MKILFVAPRLHTNQVPIMKGLRDSGINVCFYAFYKGATEDYGVLEPNLIRKSLLCKLLHRNIKRKNAPAEAETKMIRWFLPSVPYMMRVLRKEQPDVVILRERSKANAVVSVLCRLFCIRNVIIYNQTPCDVSYSGIKNWIFSKVRYTPVMYSNCPVLAPGETLTWTCAPHTYVLPFVYASHEKADVCIENEDGPVRILDVGKYRDYKNHYIVADAAAILKARGRTNFCISVIGQVSNSSEEQYFAELNAYIQEKGLDACMQLHKNIPYREMDALYSRHDMLVLPSKREVAGMVVLESMANGLCTISTDANGTATYVLQANGGSVFDHASAEDLADKIEFFLQDPQKRRAAGEAGKRFMAEQCSFDAYLQGLNMLCVQEFGFSIIEGDRKMTGNTAGVDND